MWIGVLELWATALGYLPILEDDLKTFMKALHSLLHDAVLQNPALHINLPVPPSRKHKQNETMRVGGNFDIFAPKGFTMVFTDGSS